jgi:hypothetical protein
MRSLLPVIATVIVHALFILYASKIGNQVRALVFLCARVPGTHLPFASLLLEQQTCFSSLAADRSSSCASDVVCSVDVTSTCHFSTCT